MLVLPFSAVTHRRIARVATFLLSAHAAAFLGCSADSESVELFEGQGGSTPKTRVYLTTVANAAGLNGYAGVRYYTTHHVQNATTGCTGDVSLTINNDNGANAYQGSLGSLGPGKSVVVTSTNGKFGLPAGFLGNATLNSTCAIVSTTVINAVQAELLAQDSYNDTSVASGVLYAPIVHRNNYNEYSDIRMQNPTGQKASVEIRFRVSGSAAVVKSETVSIEPGGSATVSTANLSMNDGVYAVQLVANAAITATFSQENRPYGRGDLPSGQAHFRMLHARAIAQEETRVGTILPLIQTNNYGWFGGYSVTNPNDTTIRATVVYGANQHSGEPNVACAIAARQKLTVDLAPYATYIRPMIGGEFATGCGYVGKATVTATDINNTSVRKRVIAMANQIASTDIPSGGAQGSTYSGLTVAARRVVVPRVEVYGASPVDYAEGEIITGFQIGNGGAADATVQLQLSDGCMPALTLDLAPISGTSFTVPAKSSRVLHMLGTSQCSSVVASAILTSSRPITVVANVLRNRRQDKRIDDFATAPALPAQKDNNVWDCQLIDDGEDPVIYACSCLGDQDYTCDSDHSGEACADSAVPGDCRAL